MNEPKTVAERLEDWARSVCATIRNAGRWKNSISDEYQSIREQVAKLEREAKPHAPAPEFKRPLTTWDAADAVLAWIVACPRGTEASARFTVSIPALFFLIRRFGEMRERNYLPPVNVRIAQFGTIIVEWKIAGKDSSWIVDHAGCHASAGSPATKEGD